MTSRNICGAFTAEEWTEIHRALEKRHDSLVALLVHHEEAASAHSKFGKRLRDARYELSTLDGLIIRAAANARRAETNEQEGPTIAGEDETLRTARQQAFIACATILNIRASKLSYTETSEQFEQACNYAELAIRTLFPKKHERVVKVLAVR